MVDDPSSLVYLYIVPESTSPPSNNFVKFQSTRGTGEMRPTEILLVRGLTARKVLRMRDFIEEIANVIESLDMHSVGARIDDPS